MQESTSAKSREEDHLDNESLEMNLRSTSRTGRPNSDTNPRIAQAPLLSHTDRPFEHAHHSRMNCPGQHYINQTNSLPSPWSFVTEVHLVCNECKTCYRTEQQSWSMFPPTIIPTKTFPEKTVLFEPLPVESPHQGNTLKSCIKHQVLSSPGRQQAETPYHGQIQPLTSQTGRWFSEGLNATSSNETSGLHRSGNMSHIASQTDPMSEVTAGLNSSQTITNKLDNPQPGTSRGSSSESGKLRAFDRNQQFATNKISDDEEKGEINFPVRIRPQIRVVPLSDDILEAPSPTPSFLQEGNCCFTALYRSWTCHSSDDSSNASEQRRSGGGSLLPWRIRVPSRERTSSAAAAGDLPVHAAAPGSAGPALAVQPAAGHPAPATAASLPPADLPGETSCLNLYEDLDGTRLQVVEESETRQVGTPDEDTESLSELAVRLADSPDRDGPEEAPPVGRVRAALKPEPPLHHHPPDFLDHLRETQRSRVASKSEPTPAPRARLPLRPKLSRQPAFV